MLSLPDILKTLEDWTEWARIKATPTRVDALEKRILQLEARLAAPRPPAKAANPCPYCDAELKLESEVPDRVFGDMGVKQRIFRCTGCDKVVERQFKPGRN